ncbi:MAG: NUDIX hydrolase [Myxococcales bacterium]|nr:NUDIX hydrolase [Myxococcales bacterium]
MSDSDSEQVPSAHQPWPEISRQQLAQTRVFAVASATRQSPRTGKTHQFGLLECLDWVNVVALTADGLVVLVEQYRHGTQTVTLEVPGGMIDAGETPAEAASRELLEETGYRCAQVRQIGCVHPNPALQGNRCYTFVALGCTQERVPHFDATEDCLLRLEPVANLPGLVQSGAIGHALVVAALAHAWLSADLPLPAGLAGPR